MESFTQLLDVTLTRADPTLQIPVERVRFTALVI